MPNFYQFKGATTLRKYIFQRIFWSNFKYELQSFIIKNIVSNHNIERFKHLFNYTTSPCRVRKETFQPMAILLIFIHPTWMKIVGQIWNNFATNVVLNNLHLQLGDKESITTIQLPSYG